MPEAPAQRRIEAPYDCPFRYNSGISPAARLLAFTNSAIVALRGLTLGFIFAKAVDYDFVHCWGICLRRSPLSTSLVCLG